MDEEFLFLFLSLRSPRSEGRVALAVCDFCLSSWLDLEHDQGTVGGAGRPCIDAASAPYNYIPHAAYDFRVSRIVCT